MVLLLFMLDIKNKASLAIKKFIGDLISSSPDLQDKLDNISPISFDFTIADFIEVPPISRAIIFFIMRYKQF